ncbi:MAG: leucine-rich repeat protein [Muribaculaceae bacterium]|nr:leucine-rich repeat protein [Muribaculaceae bacterium]
MENVKSYAFIGCSMASLTIPATVLTIGTNVFNYCDNLTEIVAKGEPAQIKNTTFTGAHYSGAKLHVKEQYAEAYRTATYWKNFTNIIADVVDKVDPEFPDVNHDGLVDVGDVNTVLDDILATGGTTLAFDINGDGAVNVGDVNTILEAILAK